MKARVMEADDVAIPAPGAPICAPGVILNLTWWGSECIDCGNTTPGSMTCDECGKTTYTRPLWMEEA